MTRADPPPTQVLKRQYNGLRTLRQVLGGLALYATAVYSWSFLHHSFSMAPNLSNPTIMLKVAFRNSANIRGRRAFRNSSILCFTSSYVFFCGVANL